MIDVVNHLVECNSCKAGNHIEIVDIFWSLDIVYLLCFEVVEKLLTLLLVGGLWISL